MSQASNRMLEGIRVIDLTSVVFGPYATQILADMGAEVIKVEPESGDQFRHAGRAPVTRGMGPGHFALNRGKRSIVLDLKAPDDLTVMTELLRTADVFIHNVRGPAIKRLGLGYEAVKALKPDIIYIHCVGFGSDAPRHPQSPRGSHGDRLPGEGDGPGRGDGFRWDEHPGEWDSYD